VKNASRYRSHEHFNFTFAAATAVLSVHVLIANCAALPALILRCDPAPDPRKLNSSSLISLAKLPQQEEQYVIYVVIVLIEQHVLLQQYVDQVDRNHHCTWCYCFAMYLV
jgi:hypothetical protein